VPAAATLLGCAQLFARSTAKRTLGEAGISMLDLDDQARHIRAGAVEFPILPFHGGRVSAGTLAGGDIDGNCLGPGSALTDGLVFRLNGHRSVAWR
jgi:hypothetical protein